MPTAVLLGNAQDAGVPQAGCACPNCQAAWADPARRRWVSALGLVEAEAGQVFMIDATPDFREQLHLLHTVAPAAPLAGLLLTHAHIGHYTGLIHLGFEAMATRGLPVYVTARMEAFLRGQAPWRQLVDQGNLTLRRLTPGDWHPLTPRLAVKPLLVPHRDEWSDTLAFVVRGPARQLLYLPDVDAWGRWEAGLADVVAGVAVALLDGTFFSVAELPGRDAGAIGHPLVGETVHRLAGARAELGLIHLNHSNPLHHAGPERAWVLDQGWRLPEAGAAWPL